MEQKNKISKRQSINSATAMLLLISIVCFYYSSAASAYSTVLMIVNLLSLGILILFTLFVAALLLIGKTDHVAPFARMYFIFEACILGLYLILTIIFTIASGITTGISVPYILGLLLRIAVNIILSLTFGDIIRSKAAAIIVTIFAAVNFILCLVSFFSQDIYSGLNTLGSVFFWTAFAVYLFAQGAKDKAAAFPMVVSEQFASSVAPLAPVAPPPAPSERPDFPQQ